MSRTLMAGLLAAALSVLAVSPLNAGPVGAPEGPVAKRSVIKVKQDNPYLQQCLNTCSMENAMRWSACSRDGATNPSVEACRSISYQQYSFCVTGCYSG